MRYKKVYQQRSESGMSRKDFVSPAEDKKWNEETCAEIIRRYREEVMVAEDEKLQTLLSEIDEEIETEHSQSDIKNKWYLDTLITRLYEAGAGVELYCLNSILLEVREEQASYI